MHCINLNILEDVLDRFNSKFGENGFKRRSAFMSEDKNIILKEAELKYRSRQGSLAQLSNRRSNKISEREMAYIEEDGEISKENLRGPINYTT